MRVRNIIRCAIVALLTISSASAQMSVGVRTGINISKFTPTSNPFKFGFQVGGIIDIPLVEQKLFLQTGLYCINKNLSYYQSSKGRVSLFPTYDNITKDITTYYVKLPVLASYRIALNPNWKIGINAGVSLAYGFAGETATTEDWGVKKEYNTAKTFNSMKKLDMGFDIGTSIYYKHLSLTVSSDLGIVTHFSSFYENNKITSIQMSVGYNF